MDARSRQKGYTMGYYDAYGDDVFTSQHVASMNHESFGYAFHAFMVEPRELDQLSYRELATMQRYANTDDLSWLMPFRMWEWSYQPRH